MGAVRLVYTAIAFVVSVMLLAAFALAVTVAVLVLGKDALP